MAGITEKMYGNQGGGSGDSHNKGHFATPEDLRTAFPTAEAGDYATVESTDTIWLWDSGTSAWVDGHKTDAVTSVNNKTGAVVLNASDVGALENPLEDAALTVKNAIYGPFDYVDQIKLYAKYGGSDGTPAIIRSTKNGSLSVSGNLVAGGAIWPESDDNNLGAILTKWGTVYCHRLHNGGEITVPGIAGKMAVQVATLPTADSSLVGQMYQYVGTTDSTYTHGYIYECKAQGTSPETYAWEQVDVQPNSGGAQYNYTAELEFEPNTSADVGRIIIKGQQNKCSTAYVRMSIAEYYDNDNDWGEAFKDNEYLCVLQPTTQSSIKACSRVVALEARQTIWVECGSQEEDGLPVVMFDLYYNQSDWSESKVKFIFEISCNDPLDITSTKDLDGGGEEINVNVMCVPTPVYDPNSTDERYLVDGGGYQEWRPIPQSEGLPTQTGNSGKFLTTDGTNASWSNRPIVKNTQSAGGMAIGHGASISGSNLYSLAVYGTVTGYDYCVAIGFGARCQSNSGGLAGSQIAIGENANTNSSGSIAIGRYANVNISTNKPAIQIGAGTNNTANTMCVGLGNANYRLLDTDGSIPSDRLKNAINKYSTMPTAASTNEGWIVQFTGTTDSTYTHGHLYECVSDGADPATYSWTEVSMGGGSGGSSTSATATLAVADWSGNSQTVNVTGVTASNNVIVAPAPASQTDYTNAGVKCTAQGARTLTFTCDTTPTSALTVNVLII